MKPLTTDEVLGLFQTYKVVDVISRQKAIPCKYKGIKWYMEGFLLEDGSLLGIACNEETTDYYLAMPDDQIKE